MKTCTPNLRLLPPIFVGSLVAVGLALPGCAGNNDDEGVLQGTYTTAAPQHVQASSLPSRADEPMTMFEKRRLIARLQQDPRTVHRLTPRERRELAVMAAAAKNADDEDERD